MSYLPKIHLNGSSADDLTCQQYTVYEAAQKLIEALQQAAPNGRDYYPLGPNALPRALDAHRNRILAVQGIARHAEAIIVHINEQAVAA